MRRFARLPRRPAGKVFVVLALAATITLSSAVNAGDEDYVAMLGYLTRSHELPPRAGTGDRFADIAAIVPSGQDDPAPFHGDTAVWATASAGLRGDGAIALNASGPMAHVATYDRHTTGKVLALSVSELPR